MVPVTVYVLWLDVAYEFGRPLGVFRSGEDAMAAADRLSSPLPSSRNPWKKEYGSWSRTDHRHVGGTLTVDPFVLGEVETETEDES